MSELQEAAKSTSRESTPVARVQQGQFVLANEGPHKGMRHKVQKIHDDGSMTIVPWDIHPSKCKYRMGAAKARPEQVEVIKEAAPDREIPDMVRYHLPPHMVADYDKEQARKKKMKAAKINELSTNLLNNHVNKEELTEAKQYVKPFSHAGSEEQAGWKASNKHGKVKYFGLAFKASAHKHAGIELNEGSEMVNEGRRGRPAKNASDNQEHVVMQLRKNVTMNGSKPIKFADGSEHTIASGHASKVLDHYGTIKLPAHKEEFQKHIGANHRNFTDWIGGKKFTPAEKSSSTSARGVNNDEIFGHDKPRESSTLRTVKSLKHRQIQEQKAIDRQKFRRRLADIIASV